MQNSPPPIPDDLDSQTTDNLDRLISLSDGIYAFAMTLLAVNVDLPDLRTSASQAQVTEAVLAMGSQLFVYASSFLLVALYWLISRRTFHWVVREDSTLTWLTLFQLMGVAFLPVATGLFDEHASVPIVVVVYAGTLLAIGLVGQLSWNHAQRAKLIDPNANPHLIRYYAFRGNFTIAVYLLLLVAGIFVPEYARLVLLLLVVYPFMQYLYRFWHRLRNPAPASQK